MKPLLTTTAILFFSLLSCNKEVGQQTFTLVPLYSESNNNFNKQEAGWQVTRVGHRDGTGKVFWIIDSGIDTTTGDLKVDKIKSKSFISGQSPYSSVNKHGTIIAGVIAAKDNNDGVLGIAHGATVVSVKVFTDAGVTGTQNVIDGLNYVAENAKPGDIATMTAVFSQVNKQVDNAAKKLCSKGIKLVVPAGNYHIEINNLSPQGMNPTKNFYVASASNDANELCSFSNYGKNISYAEPGESVISLSTTPGYTTSATGTSVATAVLAAILAFGEPIKIANLINDPYSKTVGGIR